MKGTLKKLIVLAAALFAAVGVAAQDADRIVGIYKAVEEGKESKVEFTRRPDGTYRGQIVWLRNPNNPDGTPKLEAVGACGPGRGGGRREIRCGEGRLERRPRVRPDQGQELQGRGVVRGRPDAARQRIAAGVQPFGLLAKNRINVHFFAPGRSIFRICTFISHNLVLKFL